MSDSISSEMPDWDRELVSRGTYEPWKRMLSCIRKYQFINENSGLFAIASKPLLVLKYRFWSAICGCDIPLNCNLGGGLLMPHPNGIVIHPDAKIGPNCIIFQQVTIGTGSKPGLPNIGGHVDIGTGAKILGGITIGDHVNIGANSVVIDDVPDNCTVVGIPAKIIRK